MLRTSEIPFISSEHGRERRSQRDISIRDLQSAVKYGIKEIGYPGRMGEKRFKYTYADVVYMTDGTSQKEITSWALELPLTKVIIPGRYNASYLEAKSRILDDASVITSHTVLIVDMSGSMNKSDMNGHKTRARGAYYNLAMEFVASRLHPISSPFFGGRSVSFSDVVTLIEMRKEPTIVLECEPLSWVLYNQFVHLAATSLASNHGNYYPSLKQAFDTLQNVPILPTCALGMFFFSDGRPSDFATTSNSSHDRILLDILSMVRDGCMLYNERLTFTAFGYGQSESEFDIMKQLCEVAKAAGTVSTFGYTYSDDNALSDILTSTVKSLTKTKTLLSCLDSGNSDRRVRTDKEKETYDPQARTYEEDWTVFIKRSTSGLVFVKKYNLENLQENNFRPTWKECPMLPDAGGIVVGKKYFGEGAERIVYLMSEINQKGEFIGPSLVAKESLYQHRKQDLAHLRQWHKGFLRTQMRAAILAEKFNASLDNKNVSKYIPRIKFLPCHVYECQTDDGNEQKEFAYLCEKRLNPLNYKKWNNNCGGVDGQVKINQNIVARFELDDERTVREKTWTLTPFAEAYEEEDEEDSGNVKENEEVINASIFAASLRVSAIEKRILECDIPQAFTHFTHRHTKREQMVCDIQGELSVIDGYPVFELTDPCIHSVQQKYGNTDKGGKGFHAFFKTHQCNAVCELLGISC